MITPLFLDVNAYYNISKNFISPATPVQVIARGDVPIHEVVTTLSPGDTLNTQTYLNFGSVDTYGFDLGINYYLTDNLSVALNYSYFNFLLDKDDLGNDGDGDGVVEDTDLPINTPNHKGSIALNYSRKKLFGSIFTRWVPEYSFFSGENVASRY